MRRNAIIAGAVLALLGIALYLWWPSGGSSRAATDDPDRDRASTRAVIGSGSNIDRTPGKLAGVVVDRGGTPIAGATVSVTRLDLSRGERGEPGSAPQPIAVITGDDGSFEVDDLWPGSYSLAASATGFLPARLPAVPLAPGEEVTDLRLTLADGGHVLSGTVTDIGGGPVGGALVRVTNMSDGDVFEFFRAPVTTMSGADGRYAINLGDGAYLVELFHMDYVGDQRFVQIAGGDRTEDFALVPGGVVFGEVRSRATDEPIPGASVVYTVSGSVGAPQRGGGFDLGALGLRASTTDDRGRFALRGLTTGTIEVRAFGPGYASRQPTEVSLGVGEQIEGVVVYVDRAYTISGRVVDKKDPDTGIAGVLLGAFNFRRQFHLARDASADDGYFEIHGVQNGGYIVGAAGQDRVVNILGTNVTVDNADVKDVIVELDPGVTLSGTVSPPTAARVSLEIEAENIGLGNIPQAFAAATVRGRTGDDGAFELAGVPDGSFRLSARTDDGSFGALDVTITGTDQTGLVIQLEQRPYIAGSVVDSTGKILEGLRVRASKVGQRRGAGFVSMTSWMDGTGVTDQEGRFRIGGLEPGAYEVSVSDRGGRLEWANRGDEDGPVTVTLEPNAPVTNLRLTVEARNQTISGTVVAGGSPVPDAWVIARRNDNPEESGDGERNRRRWRRAETPVLTDADGRFTIENLRDAVYDLEAEGMKGNARGFANRVKAGTAGARIELETLAGVTGVVTSQGQPVTNYTIEAVGPMRRRARVVSAEGRYSLRRLDPGSYQLSVIAPDGRASGEVEVKANETATADLQLVAYGSVRGVVVDAITGEPMDGLDVAAFSDTGSDTEALALEFISGEGPKTDDAGRFRVGRLGAGKGRLIVFDGEVGGFEIVAQKEFQLTSGQDLDLGELRGTAVNRVPKEKRGTIGLTLTAATWAGRPNALAEGDDPPPDGIDAETELLWVAAVEEGGPAEAAGLAAGDRILSVGGVAVEMVGASMVERMLTPRRIEIGQAIGFVYERDGRTNTANVVPVAIE